MAERKNTSFDRPGGYAMPSGATQGQRKSAADISGADIRLYGDSAPGHAPAVQDDLSPRFQADGPDTRVYIGDCRDVLANLPDRGAVDLVFADPPFNIGYEYDEYDDKRSCDDYLDWSRKWIAGVKRCPGRNPRGV